MVREAKLQAGEIEATASYARFPLDVETEVTTLGGELAQAKSNADGAAGALAGGGRTPAADPFPTRARSRPASTAIGPPASSATMSVNARSVCAAS